jgi:hypothetical protein
LRIVFIFNGTIAMIDNFLSFTEIDIKGRTL